MNNPKKPYGVLPVANGGFVIYNIYSHRITDGVYFDKEFALGVAEWLSDYGNHEFLMELGVRPPSSAVLGVIELEDEPKWRKQKLIPFSRIVKPSTGIQ
jgi:hypothetical protein